MAATPPSFNPAPAKSGNKIWLWLIIAFVAFCLIISGVIFFVGRSLLGTGMELASCAMNGELATNAILAYAKDNDGQLPNAESWQDDIRPYYEKLYEKMAGDLEGEDMPSWLNFEVAKPGQVLTCSTSDEFKTGFAFNSQLAGTNTADYDYPDNFILLWETPNPEYNAYGDPSNRNENDPNLKIFGESRDWLDFSLAGDSDSFQSDKNEFNFEISPDDALDGAPVESDTGGETTGD